MALEPHTQGIWVLASFDFWDSSSYWTDRGGQVTGLEAGDGAVVTEGIKAWRVGIFWGRGLKGQAGGLWVFPGMSWQTTSRWAGTEAVLMRESPNGRISHEGPKQVWETQGSESAPGRSRSVGDSWERAGGQADMEEWGKDMAFKVDVWDGSDQKGVWAWQLASGGPGGIWQADSVCG